MSQDFRRDSSYAVSGAAYGRGRRGVVLGMGSGAPSSADIRKGVVSPVGVGGAVGRSDRCTGTAALSRARLNGAYAAAIPSTTSRAREQGPPYGRRKRTGRPTESEAEARTVAQSENPIAKESDEAADEAGTAREAGIEVAAGVTEIPLNLVFTYPVRWSRFKVLRDLVQNFYDAIGRRDWARHFHCAGERGEAGPNDSRRLVMEAPGGGFSHEWLLHIGASTKTTGGRGRYAGFYGEGFKIAALCAHRDHGWRLTVASRDWEIEVGTSHLRVDGQGLRALCYRLRRRPWSDVTRLWLEPFSTDDEAVLEAVLVTFYYPENPLLGERIWEDETTAFYHRSAKPKPSGFPATYDFRGPGIVFAGFQALGSFDLPLVVAQHDVAPRSRERESFYRMDVVDTLKAACRRLPPKAAVTVLEKLRRHWYSYPRKRYDFKTLHPVVRIVAERVAADGEARARFRAAHPDLLVARSVRRSDLPAVNQRKQALAWLRDLPAPRPRLVQDAFRGLGYPLLEQACEEAGGFVSVSEPDARERPYVDLLHEVARKVFPELVPPGGLPPTRVIRNATAAWTGITELLPAEKGTSSPGGGLIRYRALYVAVDRRFLRPELFGEALSTYLHELAHIFGTERSVAFAGALTALLGSAADRAEALALARHRWSRIEEGEGDGVR